MIYYDVFQVFYVQQEELDLLQIKGCQTDICVIGAGGEKVFIHCAMLFADHIQPNTVQEL